uniref:Uncharacterized protein n=1 Tax=Strigamia maritima TaxID=126957 RepID=T1J7J6_STRMM
MIPERMLRCGMSIFDLGDAYRQVTLLYAHSPLLIRTSTGPSRQSDDLHDIKKICHLKAPSKSKAHNVLQNVSVPGDLARDNECLPVVQIPEGGGVGVCILLN